MGCGSTYTGSSRYRLGPAYIPQNERTRVELPEAPPAGPQIDLSNLKKSSFQSRVLGSVIGQADGIRRSTSPPNRQENGDIFRPNRYAQSQVSQLEYQAPALIPAPGSTLSGFSQIQRVESRDMASLGQPPPRLTNAQAPPTMQAQNPNQDITRNYNPAMNNGPPFATRQSNEYRTPAPFPFPPPQVQMVSALRTTQTQPPAMNTPMPPPPGYAQRVDRDTRITHVDGSRVNIHETAVQAPSTTVVPPLHIPNMNLEPMGDEHGHSKIKSFDYKKGEKAI